MHLFHRERFLQRDWRIVPLNGKTCDIHQLTIAPEVKRQRARLELNIVGCPGPTWDVELVSSLRSCTLRIRCFKKQAMIFKLKIIKLVKFQFLI